MSFKNYVDGLMRVLRSDSELNAWALSNFEASFTQLRGFRLIESLNHDEIPAQLFYPLEGAVAMETLGNYSTRHAPELVMEVVFEEQDAARAFDLLLELVDAVPRAIARNPTLKDPTTLQDAVAACEVTGWQVSDPRQHPAYAMGFKISAEYDVLTA